MPARAEIIGGSGELARAPVSAAFSEWQNRAAMSAIQTYDQEGHALGLIPSPFDRSHLEGKAGATAQAESEPPSSYDLRALGGITSVKNQGSCGSCWSFATYGSMESWLLRNEGQTWDFSENHLKNYHGFDWGPCEGGNADMSTAYLARWSGPVLEADDQYHDYDDRPSPGGPVQRYLGNALWFFTDTDIKNAVMNYGGLYVSMYWGTGYYNSSAYTYYYSGNGNPNHGVTLAGWDNNKAVAGAPGNGAWLIKNSWGASWGDGGYFWVSYYDTVAVEYAVAYCEAVPTSLYANNYQYDPLGLINAVGFGSSTAWGANIFTAAADENLDAVGTYAVDDNVSFQVYIYDDFSGNSFSNLLASTSGTLVNSGYHTISLPSPVELTEGDDFAIVVKFATAGYVYPVPIEEEYPNYASGATANPGESYISSSGTTFTDITTHSGFETANVCIKGLTTSLAATPPVITSAPVTTAVTGTLYSYDVEASGWPPPVYALTTYPGGMTIDPDSGLIEWIPAAAGHFDVEVIASNGELPDANQAFTITVSELPPHVDDVANADIAVQGNVSGNYTYTHTADNVYEAVTEVRQGTPSRGYSSLEHKWTINVTGGDTVTFCIEAYRTVSGDGDNFVFAYSTDDSSYTDMLTVAKTSDDNNTQSCELPASLAGTVYVRVVDTDSGQKNLDMDTIHIDRMYIRSTHETPVTHTLTLNTVGSGSISAEPEQSLYAHGQEVVLTANAEVGWTFDSWSGDLTGSNNPDTIVMDANKDATATFSQDEYTLTVNIVGNGTVTRNPEQTTYHYGDTVELIAIADAGWAFDSWSGELSGNENPDTIVIDSNTVVMATFTQDEYALTVNAVGNGTVTLNPEQSTYHYGDTVELTAVADRGWTFYSWSGELSGNENPDTIVIDSNTVVRATFTQDEYALTVNAVGNGTVTLNPEQTAYHYGDTVELTAIADTGWTFECWGGDLSGSENPETIVMDTNKSVTATFERLSYRICGYVLEPDANTAIADVNIFATGAAGGVTDANGYYEVAVDYGWSGSIRPIKEGWVFEPNSEGFVNVTSDINDVNYVGSMSGFIISGHITEGDYVTGVNDVNVSADGGGGYFTDKYGGGSDVTDVNGFYQVVVDYKWTGAVRPTKYAWSFDPNNGREYIEVLADQNDQDYIGTLLTYSISGHILDPNNRPIPDVLVDASNGGADVTDANGLYELWVDYDWSGTVTPGKEGYYFDPNRDTYVNVLSDRNDMDFLGVRIEDINIDGFVNAADLWYLAEYWLQNDAAAADIVRDGFIDFLDFAQMGNAWHIEEP